MIIGNKNVSFTNHDQGHTDYGSGRLGGQLGAGLPGAQIYFWHSHITLLAFLVFHHKKMK